MTNATARGRNAAPVAEAEAPKTETPAAKEKDTASIAVAVPKELKEKLEEHAKTGETTVAKIVRRHLAGLVNFDITEFEKQVRTRTSKYATEEERKAAKEKANKERSALIAKLMAKYKAGDISLDDVAEGAGDEDEDEDE